MICGSGGSKGRLAKAAGAEPCGQRRHENCTPLWPEAGFSSQNVQNTPFSVAKLHAAVARSAFSSQNAKKLTVSEHFLEVQMSKNCTPL